MDVDMAVRRSRVGRRISWSVPVVCAVLGLGFAFVGLQTDGMTLATDPCATALDNPFARIAQAFFLAGLGSSLVVIILSTATKNRDGVIFGIVAGIAGLLVMLAGMLLAGAGYGWHCPDY